MTRRISAAVREQVREAAKNCCGYCRCPQSLVWDGHEVDHVVPTALGGSDDASNLWLACSVCNSYKNARVQANDPLTGDLVDLYNPLADSWSQHFRWAEAGALIEGLTPTGRATVEALRFNDEHTANLRRVWIRVGAWKPPADA